jgi:hypothetical protein
MDIIKIHQLKMTLMNLLVQTLTIPKHGQKTGIYISTSEDTVTTVLKEESLI